MQPTAVISETNLGLPSESGGMDDSPDGSLSSTIMPSAFCSAAGDVLG
jgi:hypothetical protein